MAITGNEYCIYTTAKAILAQEYCIHITVKANIDEQYSNITDMNSGFDVNKKIAFFLVGQTVQTDCTIVIILLKFKKFEEF